MKKLFTITLATLAMAACTLETSDNGDLDGFWHLTSIDSIKGGQSVDYSQKRVFWMFQGNLYKMREYENGIAVVGHFKVEGDSLFITDVYKDDRMNGDPMITHASELKFYGIDAINERFAIKNLSSGKMTLQSRKTRLNFKKQ